MPRKITVTFADGSQHVYDNAPDDVTPQQIVDRATREFSKPVKGVDGGRGAIERAARGVGSMVTGAVDALDQAMQPVREAVGYDPAEQARKTDELARRVREKQQADIARQDGLFDAAGDLFTRGEVGMGAGIERVASGLAVTPAERQRFIDRARASERIAATPISGETTWDDATSDLTKLPGFIAEQAITSLPYMATAAIGPFGALSNAASVTGDVAQRRAEADGRQDASGRDVAIAAPFGVASTVLDSLALGSMVGNVGTRGLGRAILVDAATEGLTEGIQSGLEYTGGSIGTQRGFSASELGSQMAQGAVVGAGVGGMFGGITGGATEAFDAAGRIKFRRADDARAPGPGMREQAIADATSLTPEDMASPLDNADLAAGRVEIASATVGGQVDSALTQAGLPKAGTKVDVSNLPGGARLTGTIEDVFSDETGVGVVVRPEGGGKAMREYLDTLNELGVSITPSDPLAEADAIDAALAAQASAPVEGSSPLAPTAAEAPSPRPSGRTPSASAGGGVNFDMGSYLARVRQAESGGRDNAKAKGSSATGRYQFTDGTWLATYKQVFGNTGENDPQILVKRSDGATQDRLMQRLTADNATALRKAGLPVNDATLYLAHFAGIGGARSLLKVAPERPVETVLGKGAVAANPFLKGKTAGDVIAWAAGKMGGAAPVTADSAPLVPESTTQYADLPEAPRQDIRVDAPAPDLPQQQAAGASTNDKYAQIEDDFAANRAVLGNFEKGQDVEWDHSSFYRDGSARTFSGTVDKISEKNQGIVRVVMPTGGDAYVPARLLRQKGSPQDTAGPQDGGVAATVEAPKAGGSPATAADSAASAGGAATSPEPVSNAQQLLEPVSNPETLPAPARVEDTGTGKSVAVIGASEAEIAAISAAVPKAMGMKRKDGALVYSKKYADKIRAALDGVTETVTPAEDAPKGMRQGEVGMMLSAGESVRTTGGRTTTPFPKISMDTDRKAGNTLRNVDKWLAENALAEALARGDDFNAPMFQRMVDNPRNISQSDKDSAEQYLFGEQPPVLPPLGRPMDAAPARPATKPERPLSERDPRAYREQESKNLPEGYSLSDTSSGIVLKGPGGGMVGGYLAPSGTSGETLERAVKSAKQAAEKDVERRAKMGAKPVDRSAAIIMDPAAGTVKTVPLGGKRTTDKKANPYVKTGERYTLKQDVEYLKAGGTYVVESTTRTDAFFRNVETGGRTSVKNYLLQPALQNGVMVPAEPEATGNDVTLTPPALEDEVLALDNDTYRRYLEALRPPSPSNRNAITSRAAQIQHQFNTKGEAAMREALAEVSQPDLRVPAGFSVDPVQPVRGAADARIMGGKYSVVATRKSPFKSEKGYGNTPEEAKRDALRRVGAYDAVALKPTDQATIDLLTRMAEAEDRGSYVTIEIGSGRVKMMVAEGLIIENKGKSDAMWITSEKGRKLLDDAGVPHAQSPKPTPAPSANRLVTDERAAELRERLKAKLNPNRLNSGIDPEIIAIGTELAVYHIEKGARRFQAFASAIAADLGMKVQDLRLYMRGWYNGARDMMEDAGESVAGMDTPDEVAKSMRTLEQWANEPAVTEGANAATSALDAELPNRVPASDAGTSPGDVQRTSSVGRDGRAPQQEGSRGTGDVPATDGGRTDAAGQRSAGGPADGARGDRAGVRDADNLPVGERDAGSPRKAAAAVKGTDWVIEPGSLDESRSLAQKARDNVEAIALVKQIEREGRQATREEQAVIARYIGWGGLKNIFPDPVTGEFGKGFETLGPRLRELLTDEEYATARQSIQYAHYTSESVVRPMWDIARQLGFRGGSVFEPGMGTGNFRGMMPADIAAASSYSGIEYDHLTASIAKLLYPQSGVRQADYTRMPGIKGAVDLVIGNPPFSETAISSDPDYAKHKFVLHDFFFAKSLDALKPGGLLMFITSAGTMNKVGDKARAYLADRADLVGAIRLPGNAFEQNAGTSVTTDIVILRKRMPGEKSGDMSWVGTQAMSLPDRDGNTVQGNVNRYFVENPQMVLGEQGMFDKLVAGPRYAVRAPKGFNIEQAIRDAAARLPGSIVDTAPPALSTGFLWPDVDLGSGERKDGSFYLGSDGRLMQYRGGVGRPVQSPGKGVTGGMSAAAQERVRGLIPVKDALRQVYAADLKADTAAGSVAREKLNAAYDAFVKKFGPINKTDISYRRPSRVELESLRSEAREEARLSGTEWDDGSFDIQPLLDAGAKMTEIARAREEAREKAVAAGRQWSEGTFDPSEVPDKVIEKRPNLDPFMEDDEAYRLAAIEHYNKDTGEAAKGRAFFDNAITLDQAPKINSANDALLFSLNRFGRPDLRTIAQMSGKSEAEVVEELGDRLFEVPGKPGVYETGELYLSGNVREKLALARVEAERNPAFQRNVRALEAALPAPLTPTEIAANLGMPWLPTKVVQQFATEKLGLRQANVSYLPKLAQWMATGDTTSAAARTDWGTERMDAMKILEAALNRQTPVIRDRIETAQGEKSVVNEVATQAVQDKMAEMKAAFREWVWTDPARSANLVDLYNRDYNSLVAPKFDGTYLTTPGIASGWSWRPHQRAVIARIIQSGNTYMAHEVGAGKTSAMIGSGMEMKRLGLVSKPMYVVPNHMLGQFTKEFYEQYPLARILVADEQRFHTSRRKEFIARMAAEDWDAVIITHSAFGFIPMSDDFTSGMIQQQIDELEDLIAEIGKGQDVRITRRKVEQQKEALSQRLAGLTNRKRDQVFTFEETGVDFLFVDEAHLFRKLDFATKMGNVKGIDSAGSQMSFDLYAKSRYLEARKPGRNLALASGTPITNTMAELFSVSRYLQQGELEKRGLGHFDAWAGAFGDTVTALEQDAAGGYKPVTRFAQFVNVPELSVMVRQVMDVVGATELRQYVSLPNLKGGNRQLITVEMTPAQERYKGELQSRMEAIKRRSGPPKKGDDILLSVIGDGRKAAIDYRLIDASAPKDAGSKLERMIEEVARRHKEFTRSAFHKPLPAGAGFSAKPETYGPATQMIFSDFGINGDFPVHKYIKSALIERGIPASQIALIQDFKTHIAKQRLFNDMNEGKVRVLIGSVAKMGTGVNAQKRLRALHNMDAQWYPANDTQRNGRIIRQGNMNPEIEILDYATNGTYDSTMWGLMAKKARFIEGFMRGDPTMRDMEDLGEASQYEQASAMTTSDPRIMELTEWKQELEKIERRQMAHEREQQSVRMRLASARNDVAEAERLIPLIEQDIAKRQVQEGDEFSATLKGQTFDDRTEYGAALMAAMDALVERSKGKEAREGIGDFGGFPLVAEVYPRGTNGEAALSFYIKRAGQRESRVDMGTDARGLVTRLTNTIKAFDKDLAYATNMKATAEQRIADFEPKLGATFDDGGKAETLRAKVTDLESTLKAESDAAEAAARQSAETNVQQSIPETVLPTVSVLESDWGKLPKPGKARLDILRGRVSRWYDGLVGTTVTASDGREVRFNSAGEKKTLRAGEELLMRARAIPKIIQRGKLVSSEPSNRGGMKAVHRYAAIVRTEAGDARALMVLVRETADGSFQYSLHNVVEKSSDAPVETGREAPKEAIAPALDGGAEDGFNLVALEEVGNPQTSSDLTDISEALRAQLAALRIADRVKLRVVESLSGSAGTYAQGLISIATDTAQGEAFTLDHEAIHALRDMGLFKNEEWAILAARARRDATLMRSIRQRYEAGFQQRGMAGAKLDEAIIEEAVADLFARYQDGRYKTDGTVERVFKMLRQLFEAVRNVFAGRGLRTAEGVMQDVASGEVGARSGQASLDASPSESLPARDNMVALGGSEPTWRGKMADAFDQWRTAIQDRYLPLLKVQRQIEQQTGKSLPTERNPYMGEELMTGRIGARLEELADGHVQPLFDAMHAEKVSVEELESYLYARHAPERNARIAEINPEFTEGEGSGMTDLEAAAIMSRIRKAGKAEAMERLAARVDAIRDMALDYRVETGLISKEDADEWRSTYQFYVPLRGFKETGTDAIADGINRSGGGINVRGRESKQAFGRRSQADSPLAYSILQAEEAIVRGETNLVAQRFVNLAKANPDPEFWSINKSTARRRVNEESGLVETYLTHNLLAEDKDWTVSAKFNGVERRVTMNRQNKDARRLADAMRNLTQHQLDFVTLHLGKVNRFLSAVNTSFNPEFVITNAFRDIQTAAFNLSGEGIKGIVKGTARDYRSALVASTQGAFGKKSGEWGKWYDEFVSEGGRVYFNRVENVEEIKQRIASAAEMSAAKAGEGGTRMQAKRLFIAARDFIENANNGVENAVRLSVYKNARDAGLSPAQAASMAKNITVNFNRRGTAGPALNAAYLFFNASVQGTARILMSLRSAKVRKMMAGVMMAAAGAEMLNAMMSADDDDGESIYDKIPAFDKSRNIVLMMPDGKSYIKIPMPYGYNAFWEAGRSAAEIARRGGQRWKETVAQFAGTVADSFNPIGGSDSLLNFLAPTIADPIVDLTLNRDFTGKPIMPNQPAYGPEEPDNQRYFNSVGPHWKSITDFLNSATGGDEVQPGAIDVSPETLEYLSGTAIGSAGAFLDRTLGLLGKSLDESEDVTVNDIPFARKVFGSKPGWVDKAVFYDRLDAVETAIDRTEKYLDAGNQDAAYKYAMDNKSALMLEGAAKQAKKGMREVRKARNELETAKDRGQIDDTFYKKNKAVVRRAEDLVTTEFNTQWIAVMKARRDETGGD